MKITCQSCQAKYTIADEKVVGKTVKIKCRKCGATIVVHGSDAAQQAGAPPQSQPPPSVHLDEDAATHVYSRPAASAESAAAEWTVNVQDDEQRSMMLEQIVAEYRAGVVTRDTYVWRDGMADWLPLGDVPELVAACEGAPSSFKPPASNRPAGATAVMGTMSLDALAQPTPSPAAAVPAAAAAAPSGSGAARRAAARPAGSVDLFAASSLAQRDKPPSSAPPPSTPPGDKHVGERNENSVLFSLSALTAAEGAAKAASDRGDAVIDMRAAPARPAAVGNGRAGLDDILNLGGGIGSPMLAPPPLLAPVVEAPRPPPTFHPTASSPLAGSPFIATPFDVPKKRPVALIGGIAGGVVLLIVIGVLAFRGGSKETTASTEGATASATPTAAVTATAAAAETSAPADTGAANAPAAAGTHTSATKAASRAVTPGARGSDRTADRGSSDSSSDTKKDDSAPAAAAAPPPAAKPDTPAQAAPAPASGGGGEFSRAAAQSALSSAASSAKSCKKPDGPTGSGRVKVTFAPNGTVTSAVVDPPFGGTAVGGCIASAFKGAHVPPFDGGAVTVSKSFTIN